MAAEFKMAEKLVSFYHVSNQFFKIYFNHRIFFAKIQNVGFIQNGGILVKEYVRTVNLS
jgi:hypothetical protein